jgi:glycosidase
MSSLVDDFVGGLASEPTAGGEGTVDAAEGTAGAHRDAIYFVLVDRFANGDPSNDGPAEPRSAAGWHGGDLQGVLDHLDHLEALGVGTVWLSPVFSVREEPFHGHGAFHGYWVDDLGRVAPRFGSTALLRTLADALHARGMRLVLDMVLNHVGYETPLVAERPEWFHRNGSIVDWDDPVQLTDYDVHGLPDLAQERDDVYAHLLARSIEWIDHVAPDGFRLDAVKHIPISFWQRYNRDIAARAGEGFMLLGEALDGNPTTYGPLFREGGFTHLFDFPLYFAMVDVFCRDQPLGRIASVLYADRDLPDPSRLVTLLDNHDLPRLESVCRRDRQRIESALAFQLTARGVPSLTYGLEAGLLGETEPANRGDMDFERDHPNRGLVTELLALRRGHPALRTGVTKVYALDEDSMLAARIGKSAAVVIAVNRGTSPWAAQIPPDLATGIARPLRAGVTVDGTQIAVAPGSVALVAITAPHRDGFEPVRAAALRDVREPTMVEVPVHWVGGAATTGDVRLGGSGRELGDWDPARGVALIPDGPDRVGTVRLPLGGTFAYKLARPSGSSSAAAPSFVSGDNAYVFVTRDASITWPR